jgi:hypothetical protein
MEHVEEREFVVRLEFRCTFPEDYEGDEDGYAWFEAFRPIAAEITRAAAAAVRARPGWRLRPGNRGRPADEEVLLIVERTVASESGSPTPLR